MTDYAQQAAFHRAALLLGLAKGSDVLAWADNIIMNDDDAPAGLIQLALIPADDLSELRHALQPMAAPAESPLILSALLDHVRSDLNAGVRSVKDSLTVLSQVRGFMQVPEPASAEIASLVNAHMLATARVTGEIPQVESDVRAWLEQFAGGESAFQEKYT